MTDFRTRNRVVALGVESTSGTEESLTVGSNAIKAEGIVYRAPFATEQTNEHLGALDASASIVGAGEGAIEFAVLAKGSGTGGAAPEYAPALRAAGLAQTLLASDESGTAQSGGASTIQLAASGPSSSDDAYHGMVITTTGGTGSGQRRVISDYVGATKTATVYPDWTVQPDATTAYTVHACSVYVPASASLETVTGYVWDRPATGSNAILQKLVGGVADMSYRMSTGGPGRFSFTLRGQFPAVPAEVSDPGDPTYDSGSAAPFQGADVYLGGAVAKFNDFSFALGNALSLPGDPTATYGRDVGLIGGRRITGAIAPRRTALATRHVLADFIAGTERALWLRWGSTAGHRLSLYFPAIKYTGGDPGDAEGLATEQAPFEAVTPDGGVHVCIY